MHSLRNLGCFKKHSGKTCSWKVGFTCFSLIVISIKCDDEIRCLSKKRMWCPPVQVSRPHCLEDRLTTTQERNSLAVRSQKQGWLHSSTGWFNSQAGRMHFSPRRKTALGHLLIKPNCLSKTWMWTLLRQRHRTLVGFIDLITSAWYFQPSSSFMSCSQTCFGCCRFLALCSDQHQRVFHVYNDLSHTNRQGEVGSKPQFSRVIDFHQHPRFWSFQWSCVPVDGMGRVPTCTVCSAATVCSGKNDLLLTMASYHVKEICLTNIIIMHTRDTVISYIGSWRLFAENWFKPSSVYYRQRYGDDQ